MNKYLALLLFLVLTQWIIFSVDREPWFDVSFSLQTAYAINSGEKINWGQYDAHPPLYYETLAIWEKMNPGMSEYHWGQELSVLFGLFFVLFTFLFLQKWFGNAGEYAGLLLAVLTPYLHFGTEVRSYMLLLALCAGLLWWYSQEIIYERSNPLRWILLFILPMIHYFGVLIVGFVLVFDWVVNREFNIGSWLAGFFGTVATIIAFALPQILRSAGSWYQVSTISSFPSALFYTLFLVDDMAQFPGATFYYLGFLVILVLLLFYLYRILDRTERSSRVLVLMLLTVLAPLGLLFVQTINPDMWRLYHHRIFICVTWLFAAAILVVVFKFIESVKEKKWVLIPLCVFLGFFVGSSLQLYAQNAHHELGNLMAETPCSNTTINIGHESAFSYVPYEVYAREHGCSWRNFISTNISEMRSHTSGFDAIPSKRIYWNLTLPNYSFYYVQSEENSFLTGNRTRSVAASQDGVWLIEVSSR